MPLDRGNNTPKRGDNRRRDVRISTRAIVTAREGQMQKWLVRAAAALFVVSFLLPTARIGPPGQQPAIGVAAALFSAFVLPLSVRMLADPSSARPASLGDTMYALLAGVYFTLLLIQNGVMLYGLRATREQQLNRARRLATAAAILPWGVPFLDYQRIYRALSLARGDAVELRIGFVLWAVSFSLLAAALRSQTAIKDSLGAAR